jgi:HPt (histidine-containing phosphotransfer) domain-containing protein
MTARTMPTEPEAPPTLDLPVLERLGQELGGLEEFVGLYLEALPARAAAIAQALADGDTRALGRAAHTLRSASAFLGAKGMAALCDRIERDARAGRPVPLELGHDVTLESRRVEQGLLAVLASGPP